MSWSLFLQGIGDAGERTRGLGGLVAGLAKAGDVGKVDELAIMYDPTEAKASRQVRGWNGVGKGGLGVLSGTRVPNSGIV